MCFFFFQAEDGIRDGSPSRGLGDVYLRQVFVVIAVGGVGVAGVVSMVGVVGGAVVFVVGVVVGWVVGVVVVVSVVVVVADVVVVCGRARRAVPAAAHTCRGTRVRRRHAGWVEGGHPTHGT